MNINDIYQQEGPKGLRELARKTGVNYEYLWQCATCWRGKIPSPKMTARLIKADPRLTWHDIYHPLVKDVG